MIKDEVLSKEEAELKAAIDAVLSSTSRKKLVVAGPGTGKTTLFKRMLSLKPGNPDKRLVLTFINNLKDDLEEELGQFARVHTLHSYCLGLLKRNVAFRGSLTSDFTCYPRLASLIADDWEFISGSDAPQFVGEMRALSNNKQISFYLARGEYYDAVDFDDSVFRAYQGLTSENTPPSDYDLVLIDEYQDFNALEAGIIDALADKSPILIAGDDDQALYSSLRNASWEHIRFLDNSGDYEVFSLPFCMRCPKVIVDSVNDILSRAVLLKRLRGRIDKPYKHFPPVKGADSITYPNIVNVETSVQRQRANYMGRYVAQAISQIPQEEIMAASNGGYPTALVIAAQPYRDQIITHLEGAGHSLETRRGSSGEPARDVGLSILKVDQGSNLGWRVVLSEDKPTFLQDVIVATKDNKRKLVDVIPSKYREGVLADVDAYKPPAKQDEGIQAEGSETSDDPLVKVTSFEGAKGLSAQHVYIVGMHNGELPRDPTSIKDLEICKFVVGLTRTRKKCTLIRTNNFAGKWKKPSSFLSWINPARLISVKVDAKYWKSNQ